MNFSDSKHNLAGLTVQHSTEIDPDKQCREEVIDALIAWRHRPDHQLSGAELLQVKNCGVFSITYEGKSGEHWPDEPMNDLSESLVRDFLYRDGICTFSDEHVRLFHLQYNMMAMSGDEYLLICPYLTDSGNISGIAVVCVTKMLRQIT